MKRTRVTIKDIASELNISASTVSRALQDHPAIKQETKDAVKELAEKWNYRPNTMALNFLRQTSSTIAIIVPDITSYFFSAAVTGIQDILIDSEYNTMIFVSNESFEEEVQIIEKLSRVQIAGILIAPSSSTQNFDHFKMLQKNNIPLVIFDRDCEGLEAHKVLVDDYSGAFEAVDYLIKSGCKKIAHITSDSNLSTNNHRLQGYIDALKTNNIPIRKDYIIQAKGFNHEDGTAPAEVLLNSNDMPDAIFTVNDRLAVSVMRMAKKLNIRIPEDLSVIGFDDEPHSSYFTPELSTVWQPVYSMGMLAAKILLHDIRMEEGEEQKLRYEVFRTELIIRGTSKSI